MSSPNDKNEDASLDATFNIYDTSLLPPDTLSTEPANFNVKEVASSHAEEAYQEATNDGAKTRQGSFPLTEKLSGFRKKRSTKSKCTPGLRSGKWTPQEEAYTFHLIHCFKKGLLDIDEGTSLRWFLASQLNCEAMRVTKKLKGESAIGKQIFRTLPMDSHKVMQEKQRAEQKLAYLRREFLDSLVNAGMSIKNMNRAYENKNKRIARWHIPTKQELEEAAAQMAGDVEATNEEAGLLWHFFMRSTNDTSSSEENESEPESEASSTKKGKKRGNEESSGKDEPASKKPALAAE